MSQSAHTADADANEDVDVVLESICFSCPCTIVDEQCKVNVIVGVLIWKNEELCSLSLVDTAILVPMCKWLAWIEKITCHFSSSDFWNTQEFDMHILCVFKTKKIVCILAISVKSNISKYYQSRYSRPYFLELTFQDIEDLNMYTMFLYFESFQISSNVRNPITPAMACLWIPMLTLHIHSQHLRLN